MRTKEWLLKRLLKNILAPCVLKVTHFFSYFKRHIKQTHDFSIENFQSKNDLTENQIESRNNMEDKDCSIEKIKRDIKMEPVEKLLCKPSLFE